VLAGGSPSTAGVSSNAANRGGLRLTRIATEKHGKHGRGGGGRRGDVGLDGMGGGEGGDFNH
jgi:hypothetical protein